MTPDLDCKLYDACAVYLNDEAAHALVESLSPIILSALTSAAESMREEAARVAESFVDYKGKPKPNTLAIASAIRALNTKDGGR